MKLTRQQIDDLSSRLNSPWGRVELRCDGHTITLRVEQIKPLSYRVVTYVDGLMRGAWISGKHDHPEQKFLRKSERRLLSPAKRQRMEKSVGKRNAAKMDIYNASITLYFFDWGSGKAALRHLCKVCDDIQVIERGA